MRAAGFMVEILATYHHPACGRERKRSLFLWGGGIALERLKRAAIGGERPAIADGVENGASFGRSPLGEHVLDPRPARARRSNVGFALEAALQAIEAGADDVDAGKRGAVQRRVALGAEGSDAKRNRDPPRELRGQGDAFVDVGVGFPWQANHQIKLQAM